MLDRERLCPSTEVCRAQLDVSVTPAHHVTVTPVLRHLRLILVTVVIDDVNDNAPAFPVSSVTVPIYELAPPGSRFPLPVATDADRDTLSTSGCHRLRLLNRHETSEFYFRLLRTLTLVDIVCATTLWRNRATSGWRRQVPIHLLICSWC